MRILNLICWLSSRGLRILIGESAGITGLPTGLSIHPKKKMYQPLYTHTYYTLCTYFEKYIQCRNEIKPSLIS